VGHTAEAALRHSPQRKGERGNAGQNMKYNPDIHHHRSIRLKGYDYTRAGLYFITICAQNRLCLFGKIKKGKMVLNDAGIMINVVWHEMPDHYKGININAFQIMPNHTHSIIQIINDNDHDHVGAGPCACPDINESYATTGKPREIGQPRGVAPTLSLSDIVHRFKTLTTKRYTDGVKHYNWRRFDKKLWQCEKYHLFKRLHFLLSHLVNRLSFSSFFFTSTHLPVQSYF
jgi:REP-associated tyrosine transposase